MQQQTLKPHLSWVIVCVTVCIHELEVCYAFFCRMVVDAFQSLFNGAQVHGVFDDVKIVLKKDKIGSDLKREDKVGMLTSPGLL